MKNELLTISSQCPYEGGPGVYLARSLYYNVDPKKVYSDIYNCAQIGFYRVKPQKNDFISTPEVIPNPVHSTAKLVYSLPQDQEGVCKIINNSGIEVMSLGLKPNSEITEFNIEKLKPSVYHFIIFVKGEGYSRGNFTVIN